MKQQTKKCVYFNIISHSSLISGYDTHSISKYKSIVQYLQMSVVSWKNSLFLKMCLNHSAELIDKASQGETKKKSHGATDCPYNDVQIIDEICHRICDIAISYAVANFNWRCFWDGFLHWSFVCECLANIVTLRQGWWYIVVVCIEHVLISKVLTYVHLTISSC